MEVIKRELSNLIPELNDKELNFQFSTYANIQNSINACYNKIKSKNKN